MNTKTRFKISVPRFHRNPIDTFIFNQAMRRIRMNHKPLLSEKVEKIRKIISIITGYDPCIKSKRRYKELVLSRQLFLYFVRKYTNLNQERTGELIGKDHATVHHAERCVEKWRLLENNYGEIFNKVRDEIDKSMIN
jgi:chromosomal replication initiation ATPase DnaA